MRLRPAAAITTARHAKHTLRIGLAAILGTALLAGCSDASASRAVEKAETQAGQSAPKLEARPAPSTPFAVGMRNLTTSHDGRTLRVTIWYPARGEAGGPARRGARPASGQFPVVVFSHGLNGAPADYGDLLTQWAAAGFVVAGPAYPHTTRNAAEFNVLDVIKQPADASQVLTAVLALDREAGDTLNGHLDGERVAAAGHSAGGITTIGLFTADRDDRIDAGVVLAGSGLGVGTAFAGPTAPLLFVHGENDPLVSYASGKEAYDKVPWPKAFLTLPGENHGDPYLDSADPAFDVVAKTSTDFLRWSLYGDSAAKKRLARDAQTEGLGELDNNL